MEKCERGMGLSSPADLRRFCTALKKGKSDSVSCLNLQYFVDRAFCNIKKRPFVLFNGSTFTNFRGSSKNF
jgi:hypothetical protein